MKEKETIDKIPCDNCITLSICKEVYDFRTGFKVGLLCHKCYLFKSWYSKTFSYGFDQDKEIERVFNERKRDI